VLPIAPAASPGAAGQDIGSSSSLLFKVSIALPFESLLMKIFLFISGSVTALLGRAAVMLAGLRGRARLAGAESLAGGK